MFEAFACTPFETDSATGATVSYLTADLSIECGSEAHDRARVGAAMFMVIWPIGVLVLAVVAIICSILLTRTAFGRWVYSTGGNARAAELSGVPVKRVTVSVYVLSGICAAIAGLVLSSQLTSAGPTAGTTYELTAIAAVVIGGAALTGGRGNVRGTLLGAVLGLALIAITQNGLNLLGISPYAFRMIVGAIILIAIAMSAETLGLVNEKLRRFKASAGQTGVAK